ncbi:MAG: uracil phosphoribosyltransferase [Paludibacteraceae bacterium]|nr:uracil phosphoribosyltransferase [Paludibacteraceae bacterium]
MDVHNLSERNSLLNNFLKEIRSVEIQKDSMRFRRNLERIAEILSYELSKGLNYFSEDVQTPFSKIQINTVSDQLVVASILRAGIPFHQGVLNYFDKAENAFVSAFRNYNDATHTTFDISVEYIASPDLNGKTLILCDPMLATGGSMELSYKALLSKGTPQKVHILRLIASRQAIDYIQRCLPENTSVWVAAIDPDLNERSYIIPGLGDAGDLAFGCKL